MKLIKKTGDPKWFRRIFAIVVAVFFLGSMFAVFSYSSNKVTIFLEIWIKDYTYPYAKELRVEGNQTIASVLRAENMFLNETCLGDYCNDSGFSWKMFVNGVENSEFEDYIIKNDDLIVFNYSNF